MIVLQWQTTSITVLWGTRAFSPSILPSASASGVPCNTPVTLFEESLGVKRMPVTSVLFESEVIAGTIA